MSVETHSLISPGSLVKTTRPNFDLNNDWSNDALDTRRWGVQGIILRHHDSHGLYYDVQHADGTEGHYDPSELQVISSELAEIWFFGTNDMIPEHNFPCPVCRKKHAVYYVNMRAFTPCWNCQKKHWHLIKIKSRILRWLLGIRG